MRKKVANEDGVLKDGRKEKEESMHRKAAALAWLKHGKKGSGSGSGSLGSARGGAIVKVPNPLMSHTPIASRHQANAPSTEYGGSESIEANGGSESIAVSMCANMVLSCTDSSYHSALPYTHQASRFKAEALALQSSSSTSTAPAPAMATSSITTSPNKQQLINMTTGQSLALLSLLPHQQSQKCFNKGFIRASGIGDTAAATPWDCGSSLYDSFELLSLSNQLGRCLTTVHAAAATVSPSVSSSSYSKLLKSLASNPMQGPSVQPSYIPRSLYALPQFIIPNYLSTTTKSAKKRSSLIHPLFSSPNAAPSSACLPAPPPSSPPLHSQSSKSPPVAEDHATRGKKTESSGLRRVFNSLLKSLHIKEDPDNQKPKRSNLSEELEKLPKNRPPSSRGVLKYEDPASAMALNRSPNSYSSSGSAEMGSNRSPTSLPSSSASAMASRRSFSSSSSSAASSPASLTSRKAPSAPSSYFRNEGFRTTSKPPKSVKWLQPGAS